MRKQRESGKKKLFVWSLFIYFILLPVSIISGGAIGSLARLTALLPIGAFVVAGIPKIKVSSLLKTQFWFMAWVLLSLVWTIDVSLTMDRVVSQILFIILILPLGAFQFEEKEIKLLKKALIWSSRLTVILTLVLGVTSEGRLLLLGVLTEDPNLLCAYYLFGISHAMMKIVRPGELKKKILPFLELLVYAYAILLTGSRGGMIAAVAAFGTIYLFMNEGKGFDVYFKKIIIMGILFVGVYFLSKQVPEDMLQRFTLESVTASKGTHRLEIWGRALDVLNRTNGFRSMVGYGYNTTRSVFEMFRYPSVVMHNVYLEYLVEIGLIGLVLYAISIGNYLRFAIRGKDYFAISVMVSMIALSLSTNIIAFKPYWNIMMFIICAYGFHGKREEVAVEE